MRFIEAMQPGAYYHIYNRGINGEAIFKDRQNYLFFLEKYAVYLRDVTDTLAYCLLSNHFHLLVYVKEMQQGFRTDSYPGLHVSRQFSHFFNAYAQSFNRVNGRTGGLFESPFRRRFLAGHGVLNKVLFFIHADAEQQGYVKDFRDWPYSSYQPILGEYPTIVSRNKTLEWFEGKTSFIQFHERQRPVLTQAHGAQWLQQVPDFGK